MAVLSRLFQSHVSVPLWTMSDSPLDRISATRALSLPEYQTRIVFEPLISEARSMPLLPAAPPPMPGGSAIRPRSARSTTVPETPSSRAVCTSTSNWAALRGGSRTSADACIVVTSAPPPRTTATRPAGSAHRSTGRDVKTDMRNASLSLPLVYSHPASGHLCAA